jgi:hypothetical protein
MRRIKLSGREIGMIRIIGFGLGASGQEILEASSYEPDDLVDMMNGMMNAGFVITVPYRLEISLEHLLTTQFEINSGYAHELRKALPVRF